MNSYEYLITAAEDPTLKGRVLAFAPTVEEAEAQLRDATFNGAKFLAWTLTNTLRLSTVA